MKNKQAPIPHFVPSPPQFRAARAVLGWTEEVSIAHAGISIESLRTLETYPSGGDGLFQLEHAYRCAGIEFQRSDCQDGITDAVRWRSRCPHVPGGLQSAPSNLSENDNDMADMAKMVNL